MKIAAKQVSENRERVLDTALKLFRERGFDGVSVADLMREAGLTHGGFYNHFASKADLEAQACARAFAGSAGVLKEAGAAPPGPSRRLGLAGYVSRYLSRTWRDAPAAHCPMVAFSADAARREGETNRMFAAGLTAYLAGLTRLADDGAGGDLAARRRAVMLAATLTGALGLARSVAKSDPALSDEILATVRDEVLDQLMAEPAA